VLQGDRGLTLRSVRLTGFPRGLAAALVAAIACSPLPGTPPASPPASAYSPSSPTHRGGTLVAGDWEFPATFDILAAPTDTGVRAAALVFSPLWGLDPALHPYPDLVREVPTQANRDVRVTPDGRTMYVDVKLVPGLRWSDGQPITADDVIFTWEALRDPAAGARSTLGIDRIRAMDRRSDSEVVWTLDTFGGYLQIGPEFWVMPRHRLRAVPPGAWAASTFFAQPDAVSGPFAVESVVPGERATLAANPHYADGRSAPAAYSEGRPPFRHPAYLDHIVLRAFPSRPALLQAIAAGAVDIGFHLGPEDLHALQGMAGSNPLVYVSPRQEMLNPNHAQNTAADRAPPWVSPGGQDRPVLEALDRALDREAVVGAALGGAGRPATALYAPSVGAWTGSPIPATADPEAARRLLDDDGWHLGAGGVRVKAGRRLEFELLSVCGSAAARAELDAIRRAWSAVGVTADTGCRSRDQLFGSGGVNATGAFDMTLYSIGFASDPAAWAALALPGEQNWNRCGDSRLDGLLTRAAAAIGPGERRAAYLAVQREWLAYHCTIPLFQWPVVVQAGARVRNFSPNPAMEPATWNAADWWLTD